MARYDVVYILKNEYQDEELLYSVRSVCKNFPFRKIWFFGGQPEGLTPDGSEAFVQTGANKWERVSNSLRRVCKNDEITKDFWLFNDDFFIMKKVTKLEPMVGGSLWARAQKIEKLYGGHETPYSRQLRGTARALRDHGFDRLDYALHVPMLVNKEKGLKTLETFPGQPMFRSLYGNQHRIGGVIAEDVKIRELDRLPVGDEILLSTDDDSFREGAVGEYIRKAFPDKCRYEKGYN